MRDFFKNIDFYLLGALIPILGAGLVTMYSFGGDSSLFSRQLIWIIVSLIVFFGASNLDFKFLRKSKVIVSLYFAMLSLLLLILAIGKVAKGAQSWFDLGGFSFQPVDLMKVVLILILAKYFSRRHVEIANFKHIFVSGVYMTIPFVLVFTKMDKLTKTKIAANLKNYKNELATTWEIMPEMYYTSAEEKTGRTELLAFIDESNKLFQKP